jgi:single-stranded DNA-binding protein
MNSFCGIGRLARAPRVRFEGEGVQVATATLMLVEGTQAKPYTLYLSVRCWGKSADAISVLGAQDLISITGKLGWAKQRTKSGDEKSTLVVEARTVELLQAALPAAGEGRDSGG